MSDPADEIIEAYRTIFRALDDAMMAHWLDLELSMAQLKTLFVLARVGPVPIGRIADLLQIGLPTASHLVERLYQEGLADRAIDPGDRRRTLASLTPQGEQLVGRLRQGSAARLREWFFALDAHEQALLRDGLLALARVATSGGGREHSR